MTNLSLHQPWAVVHAACNHEKGRRWDPRRRRDPEEYDAYVARLPGMRLERWKEPMREFLQRGW